MPLISNGSTNKTNQVFIVNSKKEKAAQNYTITKALWLASCNKRLAGHTNLGAPSAMNTRNDLFFSFAAQRNSITVLELPKVNITSLGKQTTELNMFTQRLTLKYTTFPGGWHGSNRSTHQNINHFK